jgi:hypothetical protein
MDLLTDAISKLQQERPTTKNDKFLEYITGINKFSTTDEEKAFILGNLFRHRFASAHISNDIKEQVINAIKNENLETYFHGEQPEFRNEKFFTLTFMCVGLVAIVAGDAF